jgi:hypothetical protein
MNQTKEDQIKYWQGHITQALANDQSLHEYSALNKISKSALYRWKKYFSDLETKPPVIEESAIKAVEPICDDLKTSAPLLPAFLECAVLSEATQNKNRSLPDSKWLAEVIVKVIQGLS